MLILAKFNQENNMMQTIKWQQELNNDSDGNEKYNSNTI